MDGSSCFPNGAPALSNLTRNIRTPERARAETAGLYREPLAPIGSHNQDALNHAMEAWQANNWLALTQGQPGDPMMDNRILSSLYPKAAEHYALEARRIALGLHPARDVSHYEPGVLRSSGIHPLSMPNWWLRPAPRDHEPSPIPDSDLPPYMASRPVDAPKAPTQTAGPLPLDASYNSIPSSLPSPGWAHLQSSLTRQPPLNRGGSPNHRHERHASTRQASIYSRAPILDAQAPEFHPSVPANFEWFTPPTQITIVGRPLRLPIITPSSLNMRAAAWPPGAEEPPSGNPTPTPRGARTAIARSDSGIPTSGIAPSTPITAFRISFSTADAASTSSTSAFSTTSAAWTDPFVASSDGERSRPDRLVWRAPPGGASDEIRSPTPTDEGLSPQDSPASWRLETGRAGEDGGVSPRTISPLGWVS